MLLEVSVAATLLLPAAASKATEASSAALSVAVLLLTVAAILRVTVSVLTRTLAIVVVHGAAEGLPPATSLLTATLAVLPLRLVRLPVSATTALSTTTATEVAASTTAIALAAGLLLRWLTGRNGRSFTAGLWWGRRIRLFREIRFVVHYFLRYGGQFAEIVRQGAALKFQCGWVSKNPPCPAETCTTSHTSGISVL